METYGKWIYINLHALDPALVRGVVSFTLRLIYQPITNKKQTNSVAFGPQANYNGRAAQLVAGVSTNFLRV
jgi:hypothetical protein